MKQEIKSIYKFESIILLLSILLFFIQNNNMKYVLSIIALGIVLFIAGLAYKKKRDTNFFRGSATRIMLAVIIFFFIIIFLLGLILGFGKTMFSLNPYRWLQGLIPTLIITIISEKLRYLIIKNNPTEKKAIYMLTALMIVFNILLITNIFTLTSLYVLFIFLCVTVLPIIAQELLSTYLVVNYGYRPLITYKLIMNLYIYILPIMTNLGDYLQGAIGIIMPFTIYVVLVKYLKPKEESNRRKEKFLGINISFITIPAMVCLSIIIILVSGIFRYQMIAIASNSMVPVYARGDAIIFEKIDKKLLQEDDIIVFKKDNILVAHRIINSKEVSSKHYFYTKGDANNSADAELVNEDDVLGIVRRVVKYIGFPTVWLNELFRR